MTIIEREDITQCNYYELNRPEPFFRYMARCRQPGAYINVCDTSARDNHTSRCSGKLAAFEY